ncbi:MAG: leucine-rich repeat protein [Oscillospiraceae bacterium]
MKSRKLIAVMTAFVVAAGSFVAADMTGLLPSLTVTASAEDYTEGSFTYTVTDGKATVTGYTGSEETIVIPSTLGGYAVTEIGEEAFFNNRTVKSITVPGGVTTIGIDAFELCLSLESVSLPDSVTIIEAGAFYSCRALTSVNIPEKVTYLGFQAFKNCNALKSITMPDSVTSVGNEVFGSCTSLESITISNDLAALSNNMFYNCTSLTSVTIPSSVTAIEGQAFYACTGLKSVVIPGSVKTIGDSAFYECSALESVAIGSGTESVGTLALCKCTSLKSVSVDSNNQNYTSVDGVLFSKDKSTLITYPAAKTVTSYSIPNGVTTIAGSAFDQCTNLTSVSIPSSVSTIGSSAFQTCTSLKSVTIPGSVTSIGNWIFNGCTSLETVTICNGVTSIGEWDFASCSTLASITIPSSVTTIGNFAFYNCSALNHIHIPYGTTAADYVGRGNLPSTTSYYYVLNEDGSCPTGDSCPNKPPVTVNPVPQNLVAVAGDGKVTLTWDAVDGATAYTVKGGSDTTVYAKGIKDCNATVVGLTNGKEYTFRVFAYVNGKWGAAAVVKATPFTIVPQNLKAAAGDGKVTLTWDAVDGATAYTVKGGSDTTIYAKSITANSYTVSGLTNGKEYTFRVFAYANGKWSTAAAVKATPYTIVPQNVKATVGDGKVTLTWDEVPGATAYTVKGGSDSTIYAKSIKTNTATVTGLTNGKEYIFRVFAYVNGKWSAAAVVRATPVTTTPQNVKATAGDGKVTLTWDEVPGATAYTVKGGSDSTIYAKSIKTNTTTVTGLKNGTTYIFRVFAYAGGKWSAAAVVRATPNA